MLANGMTPRGRYRATWNGDQVPAGLYFVRYQFPGRQGPSPAARAHAVTVAIALEPAVVRA